MARGQNATRTTMARRSAPATQTNQTGDDESRISSMPDNPVAAVREAGPILAAYRSRLAEIGGHGIDDATTAAGIIPAAEQRVLVAAAKVALAADRGEAQLPAMLHNDAQTALELTMACNMRAARKTARHFQGQGLSVDDLTQEATFGLLRAIEKYDFRADATFLTYAGWWMRQFAGRAVQERGSAMPLPSYMEGVRARVVAALGALQSRSPQEPTFQQIVDEVNNGTRKDAQVEHIKTALEQVGRRFVSLDVRVSGDDRDLASRLVDPDIDVEADAVDEVGGQQMRARLAEAMNQLPSQERHVIRLVFGLDGEPETAARNLPKKLGISRSKAQRLHADAMTHLRELLGADEFIDAE